MLKILIRAFCQKLLGLDNYLFAFSLINSLRMRTGAYEKEFLFFMEQIPVDGTILDIGANIGVMTVALAKKFPKTNIISFEPVPANIRILERVIRFYQLENVQLFPVALGEKNDMVKMHMPVVNHSVMQGLAHVVESGDEEKEEDTFSIPMQRLDDIMALHTADKITAIKMDVENYEYYVFKGAEALLKKHRPLIYCELWNNERRLQSIAFLEALGYQTKILRKGKLVAFTGQPAINFFFLP